MGNTIFDQISAHRIVFKMYIYKICISVIKKKTFSIIYESGILGVKAFMLSQDYGYWSRTHYYKYVKKKN
jgi:hypothetical protein